MTSDLIVPLQRCRVLQQIPRVKHGAFPEPILQIEDRLLAPRLTFAVKLQGEKRKFLHVVRPDAFGMKKNMTDRHAAVHRFSISLHQRIGHEPVRVRPFRKLQCPGRRGRGNAVTVAVADVKMQAFRQNMTPQKLLGELIRHLAHDEQRRRNRNPSIKPVRR